MDKPFYPDYEGLLQYIFGDDPCESCSVSKMSPEVRGLLRKATYRDPKPSHTIHVGRPLPDKGQTILITNRNGSVVFHAVLNAPFGDENTINRIIYANPDYEERGFITFV